MKAFAILLGFILFGFDSGSDAELACAKHANFVAALKNTSTFGFFTVITVKNLNTGEVKEICTKGNFIAGALDIEHQNSNKYVELNVRRYFEFKSKKALDNVSFFEYNPKLISTFKKTYDFNKIIKIIKNDKKFEIGLSGTEMKTFAHILFNYGYLSGENDCFGGTLTYIADPQKYF